MWYGSQPVRDHIGAANERTKAQPSVSEISRVVWNRVESSVCAPFFHPVWFSYIVKAVAVETLLSPEQTRRETMAAMVDPTTYRVG